MIAVQDRSGPHHRVPGGRAADNRRAVGHVHEARIKPQRTHAGERGFKCFFLLDRLLGGEDLRRCKMREGAFQTQVRTVPERPRERGNFRWSDAESIHAGINLEMKTNRTATRLALSRSGLFQQLELLGPHDRRRKIVFQNALFLPDPESRENQDRLADTALAQFGALGGASHAKPVRAGTRKRARHGDDAVAVGVALDDRKNFPASGAGTHGIHMAADRAQVAGQRTQTYFRPDGASIKFYSICHGNRHFESNRYQYRKKIAYRPVARRLVTRPRSKFPLQFPPIKSTACSNKGGYSNRGSGRIWRDVNF